MTTAAKKTPARRTLSTTTLNDTAAVAERRTPPTVDLDGESQLDLGEMLTVISPVAFTLTRDDNSQLKVVAGVQEMREADVAHWYAQAHGVTVYKSE